MNDTTHDPTLSEKLALADALSGELDALLAEIEAELDDDPFFADDETDGFAVEVSVPVWLLAVAAGLAAVAVRRLVK